MDVVGRSGVRWPQDVAGWARTRSIPGSGSTSTYESSTQSPLRRPICSRCPESRPRVRPCDWLAAGFSSPSPTDVRAGGICANVSSVGIPYMYLMYVLPAKGLVRITDARYSIPDRPNFQVPGSVRPRQRQITTTRICVLNNRLYLHIS